MGNTASFEPRCVILQFAIRAERICKQNRNNVPFEWISYENYKSLLVACVVYDFCVVAYLASEEDVNKFSLVHFALHLFIHTDHYFLLCFRVLYVI